MGSERSDARAGARENIAALVLKKFGRRSSAALPRRANQSASRSDVTIR